MSRDIWFNSIWINVFLDNNNNCIKNYLSTFNSCCFSSIKRKSKIDFMFLYLNQLCCVGLYK
jgi:hypothetical protein